MALEVHDGERESLWRMVIVAKFGLDISGRYGSQGAAWCWLAEED